VDDRGTVHLVEVALDPRLAVVSHGAQPSLAFGECPGGLRTASEALRERGIRQHLDHRPPCDRTGDLGNVHIPGASRARPGHDHRRLMVEEGLKPRPVQRRSRRTMRASGHAQGKNRLTSYCAQGPNRCMAGNWSCPRPICDEGKLPDRRNTKSAQGADPVSRQGRGRTRTGNSCSPRKFDLAQLIFESAPALPEIHRSAFRQLEA
jgi:hypothetical protein